MSVRRPLAPSLWLCVCVACVASVAACSFDAALPDDAVVLCASDDACPVGTCDLASHTCVTPGQRSTGPIASRAVFTPAFARDGDIVVLTIDTDAPVAATPAPTLVFLGEDTTD